MTKKILLILLFLALTGCVLLFLNLNNLKSRVRIGSSLSKELRLLPDQSQQVFFLAGKRFQFELVHSAVSLSRGLSGRSEIGSDGMLFVFAQADRHGIWMKEMKFDLDLVWFVDDKVAEIFLAVPKPETDHELTDLPVYQPQTPAEMVLEVPAGFVKKWDVKVGDQLLSADNPE
jgi:uncharacterized membrane protein (UPF0127 family)